MLCHAQRIRAHRGHRSAGGAGTQLCSLGCWPAWLLLVARELLAACNTNMGADVCAPVGCKAPGRVCSAHKLQGMAWRAGYPVPDRSITSNKSICISISVPYTGIYLYQVPIMNGEKDSQLDLDIWLCREVSPTWKCQLCRRFVHALWPTPLFAKINWTNCTLDVPQVQT